jgi:hypothetical protein
MQLRGFLMWINRVPESIAEHPRAVFLPMATSRHLALWSDRMKNLITTLAAVALLALSGTAVRAADDAKKTEATKATATKAAGSAAAASAAASAPVKKKEKKGGC